MSKYASDPLGNIMKMYERYMGDKVFMPLLPVVARLDGRAFSRFTRGMARPYCKIMQECMIDTTKFLVEETGADMGYTQSDEITLAWYEPDLKKQMWYGGRVQKVLSHLGGRGSVAFYRNVIQKMDKKYADRLPSFDARAWQMPNLELAADAFLWREQDATKNSITMAASTLYSHKELHGMHSRQRIQMMFEKGMRWEDFPASFKRGTYVQRVTRTGAFTEEEIGSLPPKHKARKDPSAVYERSSISVIEMPPFGRVANRAEVVFEGKAPVMRSEIQRDSVIVDEVKVA